MPLDHEQLPSGVVQTQPARTMCNEVQGETAEKSKSRAPPVTPPSRFSSALHIEALLWGVVPQFLTRLSPHRNNMSELVGLGGRDRSQVRGGHSQKRRRDKVIEMEHVWNAGDGCQIRRTVY